jgi:nicotinamide-nucleotide amidase
MPGERYVTAPLEERIGELLRKRSLKLATAESCTGGLIASRITDIPGSSAYFLGGVVAYANQVKLDLLGVPPGMLAQFGAVSEQTVLEMARGVRSLLRADIGLSVSGIAGPGGGTPEKPVGTVWIGLSMQNGEQARLFHFRGARLQNKASAAQAALEWLLETLK